MHTYLNEVGPYLKQFMVAYTMLQVQKECIGVVVKSAWPGVRMPSPLLAHPDRSPQLPHVFPLWVGVVREPSV